MKKVLLLLSAFLSLAYQAEAITFKENLLFSAEMNSAQVIPAVNSPGKGIGAFMLNKTRDSVSVAMSFIGLSGAPLSVKIYQGSEDVNGVLIADLSSFVIGNQVKTNMGGAVVMNMLTDLLADHLYAVVSTSQNPSGEIRGQIKLEADWNFSADMSGAHVVPVVSGNGYALGSFSLSKDKTTLDYKIICQALTGPVSAAGLYYGAAGQNGALEIDLSASVIGNLIYGTVQPGSQFLDSLFAGRVYCSISTSANPAGEIRSQLKHYNGLTFEAVIDGGQMVPAITTPAFGISVIRLSPDLDTLYHDAVFDGIGSSVDYAHLHVGYAGSPYTTLLVDFTNSISGNRVQGIVTAPNVNSAVIKRLLISNLAYIVHTSAYPNGEIRGAVVRYAREGMVIDCSGSQVVSPVSTSAYGTGIVSLSRNEGDAYFSWIAGNLSSTATGAHFNKNVFGQNGPVIYDMTAQMNTAGADASASGYWKSSSSTPFTITNSIQFQKDSVYLEITNSTYPGGELRGQAEVGMVYYSPTGIADTFVSSNETLSIFPVPASDQVFVQLTIPVQEDVTVTVSDLSGRIVSRQFVPTNTAGGVCRIDTQTFEPGIYVVYVNAGQFNATGRMIKN